MLEEPGKTSDSVRTGNELQVRFIRNVSVTATGELLIDAYNIDNS
jgi:hypothetical protein